MLLNGHIKPSLGLIFIILFPLICIAQDPQFSQFYGVPLYTNPAFAGSSGNIRFNGGFREQYVGISNNYTTMFAGFDMPMNKIGGGIGLTFMNDVAGDGRLTTNQFGAIYAFKTALNRKIFLSAAIHAQAVQKNYDFSRFKFGDMIDERYGFTKTSMEQLASDQRLFPNFAAGFLVYSERFFAGFASHNLTEPNQSFYFQSSPSDEFKLPRRYTAHGGLNIYLSNERDVQARTILSPNILYMNQRNFNQLNLGMYIKKQALTAGLWFRQTSQNTDAAIILLGIKFPKFRLGYSYDVTVSGARTATQGSHEVTLAFEIKPPKKSRPRTKALICPTL
ncbi:MAG: type IX secretion system membrane protein PorP/SprF [Bacteroidia bacterium]|jgi:type IX secretion system PorP/SprF family membrane protein|nr:type IX secretion system membrane protein PorP/SprF [Bacteroidia bacterium]